jgi:hypothetical protein
MTATRTTALLAACLLFAAPAAAGMTKCTLQYTLKGWSFFYKDYRGNGTITCTNGESAAVRIVAQSGGITFGKSEINDGRGTFSEVVDISETFGTYLAVNAGAGATKSVEGQAMTKGEVSLSLAGKGRGMELGFALGGFTIERK